jgi:hypothetical protein
VPATFPIHDWSLEEKLLLPRKAYETLPDGGALIVYESILGWPTPAFATATWSPWSGPTPWWSASSNAKRRRSRQIAELPESVPEEPLRIRRPRHAGAHRTARQNDGVSAS